MNLDPRKLPARTLLKSRCKALAMLDAMICPEWNDRYYSYNANWDDGLQMGSMRNGSGDEWFILFAPFGTGIKGLDHESELAADPKFRAEVVRQLPSTFSEFYDEPAFSWDWVSFCFWLEPTSDVWKAVRPARGVRDGSSELLEILVADEQAYVDYARSYFGVDIPLSVVQQVYALTPLDAEIVSSLNRDLELSQATGFAEKIDYPVASSPS